jgi:hypothetical protein
MWKSRDKLNTFERHALYVAPTILAALLFAAWL